MYGQMTAGAGICHRQPGSCRATYETFAVPVAAHYNGSLKGRWY